MDKEEYQEMIFEYSVIDFKFLLSSLINRNNKN